MGGGNFWQGAVTGLIVAGFNELMHDDNDDTDPPNKYKKYFSSKLRELEALPSRIKAFTFRKSYNALRFTFDNAENIGGYMEIGSILSTLFTDGLAAPPAGIVGTFGIYTSYFGTPGNASMDYFFDNNLNGASYRVFKATLTVGTGKVLSSYFHGIDKPIIEMHTKFYESIVVPQIEKNSSFPTLNKFKG